MVHKKQLSDTKKLAVNKAIELMSEGKIKDSINLISKNFSKTNDIYLFFKGWQYQLQNNHQLAIKYFENSLLKNPIKEDALIGLAASYLELGDYSRAVECAEQALLINSESAQALLTLATAISKQNVTNNKNQNEAILYLEKALKIASNSVYNKTLIVDIITAIGACYMNLKNPEVAEIVLERAIAIDEFNIVANKNLASVYASLCKIDKAIRCSQLAQMTDINSDRLDAIYQEGMLQLLNKNYIKGWRLHESRLFTAKYSQKDLLVAPPLNINALTEHDSVLLFQEQGIGDFLQFSRYIPLISKITKNIDLVILPNTYLNMNTEVPSIKQFVEYNFGEYINRVLVKSVDKIHKDYTYASSLMSLPYIFKSNEKTIPSILPFKTDKVLNIDKTGLIVGIFYKGSSHHSNDYNRSIPVTYIDDFISYNEDVTFVNLQLENTLSSHSNVIHYDNEGLDNTLAIMNNCDLVITVDSMIAHLSAGAGINTFILHAYSPDWRWGISQENSEWYPSVTNIRQKNIGNWDSVFENVQQRLSQLKNKLTVAKK